MASHAALIAVMRQSATEFRTLLTKAGRGVGLSPGLSEDLARTSVWLQACGFAGGEAALDAIKGLASKDSDPGFISLSNRAINLSSSRGNLSSAYIGVQLADAVQLGWPSKGEPFFFRGLDSPTLSAAALALSCRDLDIETEVSASTSDLYFLSRPKKNEILVCAGQQIQPDDEIGPHSLTVSSIDPGGAFSGGEILLDRESEEQYLREVDGVGLSVSRSIIEKLQQFASLLLVSETEQSLKFGAGAGLVDSD
ncbi:MAG: DUF3726 domain-containing protein [Proteobacteria bacterium]|nr:DUF3726 domain-containing protein [Pseudomonadota bacterium]MBT7110242.1 DUF3726 domain-containing protein [Pseudomonadota bacterium]